jgi:hypothetical protein
LKNSWCAPSFVFALSLLLGATGCVGFPDAAETTETSESASVPLNFTKVTLIGTSSFVPTPGELFVDSTSNTILLVTSTAPGRQTFGLKQPGKPWAGYEATYDGRANPRGLGFSLSGTKLTLHGLGGDGIFSAVYLLGSAGGKMSPVSTFTAPSYEVEAIQQLVAAGQVTLPSTGATRFLDIVRTSAGDVMLHDYGGESGYLIIEMEDLIVSSYTPPIGSNKGSFTIAADGNGWATFPSGQGLDLYSLGDLDSSAPLEPQHVATLPVGVDFRPGSQRLGIIAMLIDLVVKPLPTISYQAGSELFQVAFDGERFRNVSRQPIPEGASGLIMDDGIYWYANATGVYRGVLGGTTALAQ